MAGTANPNAPIVTSPSVLTKLLYKIHPWSDPNSVNTNRGKLSLDRAVIGGVKGSTNVATKAAKNVGANFVSGHWNESGLGNIFGTVREFNKKTGKFSKKRKKKNGVTSSSGIASTDITRLIKAFRDGLTPLETSLDGIDGSMSGLRDDIQKLDDNLRKGFTALLRTFNSNAPNPFAGVRANRQRPIVVRPATPATLPPVKKGLLGSLLGGAGSALSGLFGKSGILAAGLSTLLGVAGNLAGVIRLLSGSTASLLKLAAGLAVPMARGLAVVAGASALALGKAGKGVGKAVSRAIAPKPSLAPPKPSKGTPRVSSRPSPAPEPIVPPKPVTPEAPAKAPPRPRGPDGKFLTNEQLRAQGIEPPKAVRGQGGKFVKAETTPNIEGKPSSTPKAPDSTVRTVDDFIKNGEENSKLADKLKTGSSPEVVKPNPVTTPSGEVAKPSASGVIEGTVKEGLKESGKLLSKSTLKGALAKIGGPALVVAVEGIEGFVEWSNAYDELQSGKITKEEFKKTQSKVIGKAVGGVGGALIGGAIGAALGSVVPIGGTIVGGLVGSVAGAWKGHELGEQLGDAVYNTFQKDGTPQPEGNASEPLKDRPPELQGRKPTVTEMPPEVGADGKPAPSYLRRTMDRQRNELKERAKESGQNIMSAPTVHLGVNRMVGQSEENASKTMTMPPIINAPQTTNNYGSNKSGGSGQSRQSPGSSRPTFNSLDFQSMGLGIPGLPG